MTQFYAIRNKKNALWWGLSGDSHGMFEVPKLYPDERSIRLALAQLKKKESYFYVYNDPIPYRINKHKHPPKVIAKLMADYEIVVLTLNFEGVLST
jgi:hypothetical protein